MKLHLRLATIATVACVLGVTGCRTVRNDTTEIEMDTVLQTVSYETSSPQESRPRPADAPTRGPVADVGFNFAEKAGSFGQAVGDGLKTAAGVLFLGVFKIIESSLGFDDCDDNDRDSPRGKADHSFNQWLDSRERWRRDG